MFRIQRIYDDSLASGKAAIEQVQAILRAQFPLVREEEVTEIPEKLRNPLKHRFRSVLFVAENNRGQVKGFAYLLHEPEVDFCYLDFISAARQLTGRGIGGALYERVRQEALELKSVGLFFECLPDDPRLCPSPEILKSNAAVLKFYEQYGARPIVGTAYETPVKPGQICSPYLMYDDLGRNAPLFRDHVRKIVRAVLEGKYGYMCPADYVQMIVDSFRDDPVRLRDLRYRKKEPYRIVVRTMPADKQIGLVINDLHKIHHVRERGYVESPVRIRAILKEIEPTGLFKTLEIRHFSENHIRAVHDHRFVDYLKRVCAHIEPGKSVYPYVFPIRNAARPPKELPIRAGYYCIDTFTPLNENAYLAAKRAVDCALTGAETILAGQKAVYALVRPPGHHAEKKSFGGFCYFNSNAVAAHYLSRHGKTAILDVDYHHGNGQQHIFYERDDVLTVSIHGHPKFAYPYFSGFEEEKGEGSGKGFNVNFPLSEQLDGSRYRENLDRALKIIRKFQPRFLVVALGLDTAKGDPTGSWSLMARDFEVNGRLIGAMKLPTLVVQEGGYNHRNLGINARRFFLGLWSAVNGH